MMRKPAHSRFGSSSAPSPHKSELPGADNSASVKHVTNRRKGTHVEVTADEVDIVLPHISIKAMEELSRCITFLSHDIVNVY